MHDLLTVEQAKHGNRDALQNIVEKYYPKIYNYIFYRVGKKEIAEDLTQETFLNMTKSIHRFIPAAKFSTWLYKLAHNVTVDYFRSVRETTYEIPEFYEEAKTMQVEQKLDIMNFLKQLPQEQMECIILYYYQNLRHRDIAVILDVPVSTVKTRIRRGLSKCRKIMEKEGYNEIH